ncbi:MAG: hypothetical protein JWR36_1606 [Glaciihabitans sp.]|nr:hypothetical protein [Glaciihabitans sp.]
MAQRRYPASQVQSRTFGESMLETLRRVPFGSLPKTELDLALFRALIDSGLLEVNLPVFEIARRLEITPSRVRGLLYRYRLENQDGDAAVIDEITEALTKTRFEITADRIVFGIEDPYLRDSLAALLKEQGIFADSSFNPETVTLTLEAFVDFADKRLTDDDRRLILRALQNDTHVELNKFKRVLKGTLTQLGKRVIGAAAEDAAAGLIDAAWDFTTGLLRGDASLAEKAATRLG